MKEKIDHRILQKLMEVSDPISSSDLAFSLQVSEKTVLKYLNILKEEIRPFGATIEIKQGAGSYLNIIDKAKFFQFIQSQDSDVFNDPIARQKYILLRLMLENDYINVYDLADELAISPSLLRTIFKQLPPVLEKYNLVLAHSHNHGYMIKGDEKDIRRCLTKECRGNIKIDDLLSTSELQTHDISEIEKILTESLEKFDIAISNEAINSLTLHILIAINRIETDNPIQLDQDVLKSNLRSTPEYFVVGYVHKQLQDKFNIKLPENELLYLTMHINGKQRIYGHEKIQVKVDRQALVFYNKFLRNILNLGKIDLFEDDELRISLLNHIVPFLNRVNNNMLITKNELINAKNEFPYAYELALYGMQIYKDSDIVITNPEISYFALHIALALEKAKTNNRKFNVAIICKEISSVYHIISYKLNRNFQDRINAIKFLTTDNIIDFPFEDYQLILNSTNSIIHINREILNVSSTINFTDINNINIVLDKLMLSDELSTLINPSLFFKISASNKDEALEKHIAKIRNVIELPNDFKDNIMQRENLESTEYDNRIAMPHPLNPEDLPGFVSIAKLNKPIKWHNKNVQLIFMVCTHNMHHTTSSLFDKLSKIICDETIAQQLIQAKDYNEFMQIFINL